MHSVLIKRRVLVSGVILCILCAYTLADMGVRVVLILGPGDLIERDFTVLYASLLFFCYSLLS